MLDTVQRRYLARKTQPIRLQERADGALPLIVGYAAVFYREDDPGTEYEMLPAEHGWPRLVERIMPTAFNRAVKEDDVRALFDHNSAAVLGRSGAGTLRLFVDERGLRYEIDPPDTQTARDLLASLRRGDISGSSFAFLPRNTVHRSLKEGNTTTEILERHDVQLFDVGPVTFPAYPGASAGVRAAGDLAAVRDEVAGLRAARDRDAIAVALLLLDDDEID